MPVLSEQKQPAQLHPEAPRGISLRDFPWKLAVTWALLLFALLNLGLWQLDGKRSKDVWHGTGSIDLAVDEFNALPQKPNVVLLGSSLMMYPFWSMDKFKDPKNVGDIFHHHGSKALEEDLQKVGFESPHVFSFAIFGQMVSDAFIYVNEYLAKNKTPDYLVYGIAPRDFSDYDLSSPMATNTFKRLVNLDNLAPYANLYLPGMQDKIDFVMSRCCYFYSHRWRLQQDFNKLIERGYIATGIHQPDPPKPNFANAGFMLFGGLKERWDSSEQEYARRYKNIAERDLSLQMGFLKRLVEVSRERKIKLVLLNMPLSDVNRNLLPAGFYAKFRNELAVLANKPGVKFVDLGDSPEFTHSDYWDTAHLGPSGGYKVLKHLVPALSELKK